jgi:hypothetical protein
VGHRGGLNPVKPTKISCNCREAKSDSSPRSSYFFTGPIVIIFMPRSSMWPLPFSFVAKIMKVFLPKLLYVCLHKAFNNMSQCELITVRARSALVCRLFCL